MVDEAKFKAKWFLEAKHEIAEKYQEANGSRKNVFPGNRLTYAALILNQVIKERDIDIERDDLIEASEFCHNGKYKLDDGVMAKAMKDMKKVFKHWFPSIVCTP